MMACFLRIHSICNSVFVLCFRAFHLMGKQSWRISQIFSQTVTFSVDDLFLKMSGIVFLQNFSTWIYFSLTCVRAIAAAVSG